MSAVFSNGIPPPTHREIQNISQFESNPRGAVYARAKASVIYQYSISFFFSHSRFPIRGPRRGGQRFFSRGLLPRDIPRVCGFSAKRVSSRAF